MQGKMVSKDPQHLQGQAPQPLAKQGGLGQNKENPDCFAGPNLPPLVSLHPGASMPPRHKDKGHRSNSWGCFLSNKLIAVAFIAAITPPAAQNRPMYW